METKPTPTAAEFHSIWVTALRNGRNADTGQVYVQAQTVLQTRDGFCCLGVACDIVAPYLDEQWEWREPARDGSPPMEHAAFYDDAAEMPSEVLTLFGLNVEQGDPKSSILRDGKAQSLATLNDEISGREYNFNAIADAIVASPWYLGDPNA